ncbi:MAG: sulfatase-like hydrolase/transferase [Pseudomonadota bacterium]
MFSERWSKELRGARIFSAMFAAALIVSALVIGSLTAPFVRPAPPQGKPNIIFFFADDLAYWAIGSHPGAQVKTPNIDRLMRQGVQFENAFNMGAWDGAVCVASRAMLLSGRHLWDAKTVVDEQWKKGEWAAPTWGSLMRAEGYETFFTGKWHSAIRPAAVFDVVASIKRGMPRDAWNFTVMDEIAATLPSPKQFPDDVLPVGYNRPRDDSDSSWSPSDPTFGGYWAGGLHWSEGLRDDAISYIRALDATADPFFMFLSFNAPHDPRQSPQKFVDLYPPDDIQLPPNYLPAYPYRDDIGSGASIRGESLAPMPRTPDAIRTHLAEYYALITHMDQQIGQIMTSLDETGLRENTYIVFTSDNGIAIGRHGLMAKQSMYEHSVRAPFSISGPTIPVGKVVKSPIYLQDAMATALALAGADKPPALFYKDVVPLIDEDADAHYPAIYAAYKDLQRLIRKEDYKLIVYTQINTFLLFDLREDPHEINNLATDPGYSAIVDTLFHDLVDLQDSVGDELDLAPIYAAWIDQQ